MPDLPDTRPIPGNYTHYKGARYRVLGLVRHSETEQWLVIYQALYGERDHWARPLGMFMESVTVEGKAIARFTLDKLGLPTEKLQGSSDNFGDF